MARGKAFASCFHRSPWRSPNASVVTEAGKAIYTAVYIADQMQQYKVYRRRSHQCWKEHNDDDDDSDYDDDDDDDSDYDNDDYDDDDNNDDNDGDDNNERR